VPVRYDAAVSQGRPCAAHVRERCSEGGTRPCTRAAVRVVKIPGADFDPEPLCGQHAQHARQAEAGVNVFDPDRPVLPHGRRRKRRGQLGASTG